MCSPMKNAVSELALALGVSEGDLLAFANGIINDLDSDQLTSVFCEGNDELRNDIVAAYALQQTKKFESFHTQYLTNSTARDSFNDSVFSLLSHSVQEDRGSNEDHFKPSRGGNIQSGGKRKP